MGYNCWCSNYVPADQESTYDCNQQCPGFGSEWCGSTDAGLYGYYLLSPGVPLGTSGSSGSSTPSTTSSPSTPSDTSSSTYIPPTTSSDTPTTSPTLAPNPTPSEVYTSVTTVTGEVRTILVTPTPAASSDATLGQSATGGAGGKGDRARMADLRHPLFLAPAIPLLRTIFHPDKLVSCRLQGCLGIRSLASTLPV